MTKQSNFISVHQVAGEAEASYQLSAPFLPSNAAGGVAAREPLVALPCSYDVAEPHADGATSPVELDAPAFHIPYDRLQNAVAAASEQRRYHTPSWDPQTRQRRLQLGEADTIVVWQNGVDRLYEDML